MDKDPEAINLGAFTFLVVDSLVRTFGKKSPTFSRLVWLFFPMHHAQRPVHEPSETSSFWRDLSLPRRLEVRSCSLLLSTR